MDDILPQTMLLVLIVSFCYFIDMMYSFFLPFVWKCLISAYFYTFQYLTSFTGNLVLVSVSNPWTILLTVPVVIAIIALRQYALKATRDIKRIESVCKYAN